MPDDPNFFGPPSSSGTPSSSSESGGAPSLPVTDAPPDARGPKSGRENYVPQSRLDQLNRQKHDALRALDEERRGRLSLEHKLQQLEGKLNEFMVEKAAVDDGPIAPSWEKLSNGQLYELLRKNSDDPDVVARAVDEIARRRSVQEAKRLRDEYSEEKKRDAEVNYYLEKVRIDFGPESGDKNSDLSKRAREHAAPFIQMYGENVFLRSPQLVHHVYALADRDLKANRLSGVEQELARLQAAEKQRLDASGYVEADAEHEARLSALREKGDKEGTLRAHAERILKMVPRNA